MHSISEHLWHTKNSKKWLEYEKIRATLENYVKTDLYHNLKFISSPMLIQYSTHSKSLCQVVCKHMNVHPIGQETFWLTYSGVLENKLNQKRSDVSNLTKKTFKGMKNMFLLCMV